MLTKKQIINSLEETNQNVDLFEIWQDESRPLILRKICRDILFRLNLEGIMPLDVIDISKCPTRKFMKEMYGMTDHMFVFDTNGLKIVDVYYGDGTGSVKNYPHIEAYHYVWSGEDTEDGIDWDIQPDEYEERVPHMLDRMVKEYLEFHKRYSYVTGGIR